VQFVPVRLDRSDPARWTAMPTARGTRGLGDADGLAVIPASERDVAAGEFVTVTRW
jgi:molybdopterin molybdotransferase